MYLGFTGDAGEARVRAAYGEEKDARLASIKGEWDPGNVLSWEPEHQTHLTSMLAHHGIISM